MSELLKNQDVRERVVNAMRAWKSDSEPEKAGAGSEGVSPEELIESMRELLNKFAPEDVMRFYTASIREFIRTISADRKSKGEPPSGHPLRTLSDESTEIMRDAGELAIRVCIFSEGNTDKLRNLTEKLRRMGFTHHNKEEMIVFPYLEKKGVGALVTSLWRSHDRIRDDLKEMAKELEGSPKKEEVERIGLKIAKEIAENSIREMQTLYPTANILLSEGEWAAIKSQEAIIGYYGRPPEEEWKTDEQPVQAYDADPQITDEQMQALPPSVRAMLSGMQLVGDYYDFKRSGDIRLNSGYMLPEEIDALLNHLPLDVTFIDSDDRVRFFSRDSRSFVRTESVLGRMVWFCHPPRSVSTVEKIIESFKSGEKSEAEFWINMNGRLMHIRYLAVRDKWGDYIGTLETVQDITDLRKIQGEKRLLDWED